MSEDTLQRCVVPAHKILELDSENTTVRLREPPHRIAIDTKTRHEVGRADCHGAIAELLNVRIAGIAVHDDASGVVETLEAALRLKRLERVVHHDGSRIRRDIRRQQSREVLARETDEI